MPRRRSDTPARERQRIDLAVKIIEDFPTGSLCIEGSAQQVALQRLRMTAVQYLQRVLS
jgi:hypothetical protein